MRYSINTFSKRASKLLCMVTFFSLSGFLWAQNAKNGAFLAYADNEAELSLLDANSQSKPFFIGDEIKPGETLKTGATSAELSLVPNGSIVKLARNTTFKIEGIASTTGSDTNEFALLGGKIRTVAARSTGLEKYRVRTLGAICGVRGTDFTMNVVDFEEDSVFVARGSVSFTKIQGNLPGQEIIVGAGQFANTFSETFASLAYTAEQAAKAFADTEFNVLDPLKVPQAAPQGQADEAEQENEVPEPSSAVVSPPSPLPLEPAARTEAGSKAKKNESKLLSWLGNVIGFEIGSININGMTYSKAIIQPVFSIGKLRTALYLPIIYDADLFDSSSWYHPAGNNEWSFGSEYWANDRKKAALDALSDLSLKIRYIEYGDRYNDPFYFNIGNLSTMTLGHGILMRNFANDADFPSFRRVGINAGFDASSWGAELVVNDLAAPEIFGGRIKMFHILGMTLVADMEPAGDLEEATQSQLGDPLLLGAALDIDIPLLRLPLFSLRAFTDIGALAPYTREAVAGLDTRGLQSQYVYDSAEGPNSLRNYGYNAGFLGRLHIMDWRLEYRHFSGTFRPAFFNATYERNRSKYITDIMAELSSPEADPVIMEGVYGEAGFNLFREHLTLKGGYFLPWSRDSELSWKEVSQQDYVLAKLEVKKGLIPIINLSGYFSYERSGFAYALSKKNISLFDEYSLFKTEIVYPLTTGLDLAVGITTAAVRDTEGRIVYEDNKPKIEPTVSLETRIHF
ncbi:hypothetical protein MASR2M78_32590 [Treponema sp.]